MASAQHGGALLIWILSALAAVFAVSATLLVWALNDASDYRVDVERWLAANLGHSVSIGHLGIGWHGLTPELRLQDVHLAPQVDNADETLSVALELGETRLVLDPLATLRGRGMQGAGLQVHDATFWLSGPFADTTLETLFAGAASDADGSPLAPLAEVFAQLEAARFSSTRVVWRRPAHQDKVLLHNLEARYRGGEEHSLQGVFSLSERVERQIDVSLRGQGTPFSSTWSAHLSAAATGIRFNDVVLDLDMPLPEGKIDLALDGELDGGRLQSASARLALHATRPAVRAEGELRVFRDAAGLRADVTPLTLRLPSGQEAQASLSATVAPDAPARLSLDITTIDLEDLLPWWERYAPDTFAMIREFEPRATVRDLRLVLAAPGETEGRFELQAAVENLTTTPHRAMPGCSAVAGELLVIGDSGHFDVRSGQLLGENTAFPTGAQPQGTLSWGRAGSDWLLRTHDLRLATEAVEARVRGNLRWHAGAAHPVADIALTSDELELAALPRLFGDIEALGAATEWLSNALERGRLLAAALDINGTIGAGNVPRLSARADFRDATLVYHPRWPKLEGLAGTIAFDGSVLDIGVATGTVFDTRVHTAMARVSELSAPHPLLAMTGMASGRSEDAAEFLSNTPLGKEFDGLFDKLTLEGRGEVELELEKRLTKQRGDPKRPLQIKGRYSVRGNHARVRGLSSPLTDVHGEIAFSDQAVHGQGIKASYLGRPIDIAVDRDDKSSPIKIQVAGAGDPRFLADYLRDSGLSSADMRSAHTLLSRLDGTSGWHATLQVPSDQGVAAPTTVAVVSNLKGVAVDLPPPLGKAAPDERTLTVTTTLQPGQRQKTLRLRLPGIASAELTLAKRDERFTLERALLNLGASEIERVETNGLHVRGALARVALAEWWPILSEWQGKDGAADRPRTALARSLDIEAGELLAMGARFEDTRLIARAGKRSRWTIDLDGSDIEGQIVLPAPGDDAPVDARFKRLNLSADHQPERASTNGRQTAHSIRFNCEECSYRSMPLGRVELVTRKGTQGMYVDVLDIQSDTFSAMGNGFWSSADQSSRFALALRADELSALLSALGYNKNSIVGGRTLATLDLRWPGHLLDIDPATVTGNMSLDIGRGRLLDIERGATRRVFGLLMIADLPKRLTLNFDDLFEQGFAYEYIDGSFRLESGDAYTADLLLKSPAADIEISGRTGLVAKDYDQLITVTPKIASTLPFAPVWLAEKALRREFFDSVFTYRYTVHGSWEEPVIKPAPRLIPEREERG